jgi:hypothetical protein
VIHRFPTSFAYAASIYHNNLPLLEIIQSKDLA